MMKEDEEEEEQKRASKEYAPATYTRYPPPSYDYKQPNIRFDETPTKVSLFSYPCTVPCTLYSKERFSKNSTYLG